jgi:predicted Zn-dependent protease
MKKLLIQGILIIVLFLSVWMALTEIDWMSLFKVEQISNKTDEKLGDLFWDLFKQSDKEITDKDVTVSVDSILSRICTSNDINKYEVKLHIVKNEEVNAFALPGNHLILFTGLILDSQNESELAGVISHEIAHMRMNHVSKKLVKEVGLSAIISMTSGNTGSEIMKETIKLLSSAAYDRNLEKEADLKAIDYLINSQISPKPFANFLARLADTESALETNLSWVSTHPDSKERAEYILSYCMGRSDTQRPVLSPATWEKVKKSISGK